MAKNEPEITTGEVGGWTYEITTTFVQVPDDKRDAYWATLAWLAEEILKLLQNEVKQNEEKLENKTEKNA